MIPLSMKRGKVDRFILSRVMFGCCYGDTPSLNELIQVRLRDGGASDFFQIARVSGTLEVGEELEPGGYVQSLFRLTGDSVVAGSGELKLEDILKKVVPLLVVVLLGIGLILLLTVIPRAKGRRGRKWRTA